MTILEINMFWKRDFNSSSNKPHRTGPIILSTSNEITSLTIVHTNLINLPNLSTNHLNKVNFQHRICQQTTFVIKIGTSSSIHLAITPLDQIIITVGHQQTPSSQAVRPIQACWGTAWRWLRVWHCHRQPPTHVGLLRFVCHFVLNFPG